MTEKEIIRVSAALNTQEAEMFDAAIRNMEKSLQEQYPGAALTRSSVVKGLIEQFIKRVSDDS